MTKQVVVRRLDHLGPLDIIATNLSGILAEKIKAAHGVDAVVTVNGHTPAGRTDIRRFTDDPAGMPCPDCAAFILPHTWHECEVCAMCKEPAPKDQPHGPCVSCSYEDVDDKKRTAIRATLRAYKV